MKLLIVTQSVAVDDLVLGFFHTWIAKLAGQFESITVICLYEGEHSLPANVTVRSLGKESGAQSPFTYALRFLILAWTLREDYDSVLVHMNQEYILLAGWLWKFWGKPVYLWRNHYAGTWLTDIAAALCTKVFCTSRSSYTATYNKTVLLPVGVDTERFHTDESVVREPRSILLFGRVSPSKRPDVLIEALGLLIGRSISFVANIYGSPKSEDTAYYESLKARVEALGLHGRVRFSAGVPNYRAPAVYQAHDIFVNCSPSGMFDKTIFEAAASGCIVLAVSKDLKDLMGPDHMFSGEASELAERLEEILELPPEDRVQLRASQARMVQNHSLDTLIAKLTAELT